MVAEASAESSALIKTTKISQQSVMTTKEKSTSTNLKKIILPDSAESTVFRRIESTNQLLVSTIRKNCSCTSLRKTTATGSVASSELTGKTRTSPHTVGRNNRSWLNTPARKITLRKTTATGSVASSELTGKT